MTHAAVTTTPPTVPNSVPVAVLGTDALLAAFPATPVQLAHACLRAGFASVIPASWGDELIAAAMLRRLPRFGSGPVIQCSCPIVAHRLLSVGGDLRPVMLPLVSPPVAVARYVRALSQPTRTRITYVGACPGANDDSIDIRMMPEALIAMLAERNITVDEQPRVFDSIIPPDRRRYRSQPGGIPSAEVLWTENGSRTIVEIDGEDLVTELAQHLLTGKNVLLDASARVGCVCSGAVPGSAVSEARIQVLAHEPPRSATAIVEERAPIDLDLPVPAVSRTPIDITAIPVHAGGMQLLTAVQAAESSFGTRSTPPRSPIVSDQRPARASGPVSSRNIAASVTPSRDAERRSLPRTYVGRRRSPTRAVQALTSPAAAAPAARSTPAHMAPPIVPVSFPPQPEPIIPAVQPDPPAVAPPPQQTPRKAAAPVVSGWSLPPRPVIIGAIVTLALVIVLSVVIGALIERSLTPAPASNVVR
jgi:hypothetical protein